MPTDHVDPASTPGGDPLDRLLDRVTDDIRRAEPPADLLKAAEERGWRRLAQQREAGQEIRLIGGTESGGRRRRRAAKPTEPSVRILPWAIAAGLLIAVLGAWLVLGRMAFGGPSAEVQTVDGDLFQIAGASHLPVASGDPIHEGDVVRTGRDQGAVLRLDDGSLIEMRERTELSIDEGLRGTTLRLARGSVIVEAAPQRDRKLHVETDDCLVSVVGTIFSVDHGTKGSRVSVIEGEVHVDTRRDETVLTPGMQIATDDALDRRPLENELAWSRDVGRYLQLLRDYSDLRNEIAAVPHPELRVDSRLLDLMPAETTVYAAAPNLGEVMREVRQLLEERLGDSEALAAWRRDGVPQLFETFSERAFDVAADLSLHLGAEVALGLDLATSEAQRPSGGLLLAEVVDADGLRAAIERIASGEAGLPTVSIETARFAGFVEIEDPRTSNEERQGVFLWIDEDLAAMADSVEALRRLAERRDTAQRPFVGSSFHATLEDLYAEGVALIAAADLERLLPPGDEENLAFLGVDTARHLVIEQKKIDEHTQHRASVAFGEARQGVASWLAEPAPMGSLEFVAPDAKLATAAVFRDPALLLDDLSSIEDWSMEGMRAFEERNGLSLRDDVAATLGGEILFALDGPLLPEPAWKLIVEVYDPARFQWALERSIEDSNDALRADGLAPLELEERESGGRTLYTLSGTIEDVTLSASYTFVDGYLVAGANPAVVDQALRYRASGYTLATSPSFLELLPVDRHNNFSAFLYQDLGSSLQPIAERLTETMLDDEQRAQAAAIGAEMKPALVYAYGAPRRVTLAASSQGDALSTLMMRALGMRNPAGLEAFFGLLANVDGTPADPS